MSRRTVWLLSAAAGVVMAVWIGVTGRWAVVAETARRHAYEFGDDAGGG